jgi:2OG-Fe(II) oxygenase superfamily
MRFHFPMQIDRFGFNLNQSTLTRAQEDFSRTECAFIPGLIEPALARRFAHDLDNEVWTPLAHQLADETEFGSDLSVSQKSPTLHAFHLLLNSPPLFKAIQMISRCRPISCFAGRIYRNLPSPEHHLDWHDDLQTPVRLVGLSISLTIGTAGGGRFRVRRKSTREILAEVSPSDAGNAHIFRIDRSLEHCVTATEGQLPRTAFAGWFQSWPDRETLIRDLFGADAGNRPDHPVIMVDKEVDKESLR